MTGHEGYEASRTAILVSKNEAPTASRAVAKNVGLARFCIAVQSEEIGIPVSEGVWLSVCELQATNNGGN